MLYLRTITGASASGGDCAFTSYCYGFVGSGNGGLVKAAIAVKPGQTLYVYVGGQNGSNGGGAGSNSGVWVNGGGASDVRQGGSGLKHRVIVAGGGGGGGTQIAGGAAGNGGQCQYFCSKHRRGSEIKPACRECGGGNGVAGIAGSFLAGGAPGVGGGSSAGGGGGGGSSYIEKGAVRLKDRQGGAAPGDGQIIISW